MRLFDIFFLLKTRRRIQNEQYRKHGGITELSQLTGISRTKITEGRRNSRKIKGAPKVRGVEEKGAKVCAVGASFSPCGLPLLELGIAAKSLEMFVLNQQAWNMVKENRSVSMP